jgi:hypothetical protein
LALPSAPYKHYLCITATGVFTLTIFSTPAQLVTALVHCAGLSNSRNLGDHLAHGYVRERTRLTRRDDLNRLILEEQQKQKGAFGLYYGSVDSTPLFVLAGLYAERTGDGDTIAVLIGLFDLGRLLIGLNLI